MPKHIEADAETEPSDQVVAILGAIAERCRKLVKDFLARQPDFDGPTPGFSNHSTDTGRSISCSVPRGSKGEVPC